MWGSIFRNIWWMYWYLYLGLLYNSYSIKFLLYEKIWDVTFDIRAVRT